MHLWSRPRKKAQAQIKKMSIKYHGQITFQWSSDWKSLKEKCKNRTKWLKWKTNEFYNSKRCWWKIVRKNLNNFKVWRWDIRNGPKIRDLLFSLVLNRLWKAKMRKFFSLKNCYKRAEIDKENLNKLPNWNIRDSIMIRSWLFNQAYKLRTNK